MVDVDATFLPDYDLSVEVGEHEGHPLAMLRNEQGWYFMHLCKREYAAIICAPSVAKHSVVFDESSITVTPSILCVSCGLHGFVTDSTWRYA